MRIGEINNYRMTFLFLCFNSVICLYRFVVIVNHVNKLEEEEEGLWLYRPSPPILFASFYCCYIAYNLKSKFSSKLTINSIDSKQQDLRYEVGMIKTTITKKELLFQLGKLGINHKKKS